MSSAIASQESVTAEKVVSVQISQNFKEIIPENRTFERGIFAQFSQRLNSQWLKAVGDEGFEPATNRLRVYCSTVELVTHTNNHISKLLTDLLVLLGSQSGSGSIRFSKDLCSEPIVTHIIANLQQFSRI